MVVEVSNNRQVNQRILDENLTRAQRFLNQNGLTMNKKKKTLVESMIKQKWSRLRGVPPSLEVRMETGETKVIEAEKYTQILGCNIPHNLLWHSHIVGGEKPIHEETPDNSKQYG